MKKRMLLALLTTFMLTGCNPSSKDDGKPSIPTPGQSDPFVKDESINNETSNNNLNVEINDDIEVGEETNPNKITDLSVDGIVYNSEKKLFTISKAGEFIFKGNFVGNILVDAGDDDDVKITLSGFTIKSNTDSPIKCINANELQISLKKDTVNNVYDTRPVQTEDDDSQGNGAITSSCDLKVSGKGSLYMIGNYKNGLHTKDDLTIKPEVNNDSKIEIKSVNNCLKGNDSVEIKSGNLVLISTSGNGIVTENTDISSKGNQRGTISISGGHVDIYSAKDGIDASYNVEISKVEDGEDPILNIYTSNFSEYSGEIANTSLSKMYLRTSVNLNSNYYYAVEFMLDNYTTTWSKVTKVNSSDYRYNYFEVSKPSNATSLKVGVFSNSITKMSEDDATLLMSEFDSINSYYDVAKLNVYDSAISISGWTSYQTSQQGGHGGMGFDQGNSEKADYSAKGIKADNEINISAGKFFIKSYDDAIHANYGDAFENGQTGLGNVNISGGTFEIYASDDGIHADNTVTIQDSAVINIVKSYEGIEGNIININGGYTKVYSTDDGLNASKKSNKTPSIVINGGIIDVTVYGQDVDGIDSNGSFTQNGGYVITKGGSGGMSTGLDCDGTAIINAGTFIGFGSVEKNPSVSSSISGYKLSGSYSIGNYSITLPNGQSVTVSTKYSYSTVLVFSDSSTKVTISKI